MKPTETDPLVTLMLSITLRVIVVLSFILTALATFAWGDDAFSAQHESRAIVVAKHDIKEVAARTAPRATSRESHQRLCVRIEGKVGCIQVTEDDYHLLDVGTHVSVVYTIGRFTGDLHIKNLH